MTCTTCNDKGYIWVKCSYCKDSFGIDPMMPKDMRCPECEAYGGGDKVPVDCPDCKSDKKSELPVELL